MTPQQGASLQKRLFEIQQELDHLILSTPTSDARSHLTDVNIHVLLAVQALTKVNSAPKTNRRFHAGV